MREVVKQPPIPRGIVLVFILRICCRQLDYYTKIGISQPPGIAIYCNCVSHLQVHMHTKPIAGFSSF